MKTLENIETGKPDTVDTMPSGATPDAPAESGDSAGVSILSLVTDVSNTPYTPDSNRPTDNPLLGRDGQPRRKPGRPRKTPAPETEPTGQTILAATPVKNSDTPAQRRANKVASTEVARALLNVSVGAMSSLVGPEWEFSSQEEADGMRVAVAAYIEAKGDGNVSPEAMLLLVIAGYAVPRAAHENTRSKLGGFFKGVLNGLKSLFTRK